ncbi:PIG-L family deacetylase [Microbacterium sp. P06]|uniref:PIG-L family deacetylase n=1 Tax=Microbacterium sp. P06 TaxID=3366949 RepID=UPI00374618C1
MTFDHRDPGTLEAEWADAAPWRSSPPLPLDADAVVILSAHPDDETLGAGGLLARCQTNGVPVTVIVVTDGGASHPSSDDGDALRRERRREVVNAVADLAPSASLVFLGFTDGRVREQREEIAETIRGMMAGVAGTRILLAAPWWGDGHRDHRVLGEIAIDLAGASIEVIGYPIWFWHWGTPADADTSAWQKVELTDAELHAKSVAIGRHRTQVARQSDGPDGGPTVHDGMRAHFLRATEVFVTAPAPLEASVGVAAFDDFFQRHDDPWGFDTRWYEQRKRAVLLAALPRPFFDTALELGCATGVTTADLAPRCGDLLAVDGSAHAVSAAVSRTAGLDNVRIAQRRLPAEWPDGVFDLIVVSELAYYLGRTDREGLARSIRRSLTPDGVVVACHWRRPIDDAPSSGDRVHLELAHALGMHRLVRHEEADFLLEVFTVRSASVAEREGLA